MSTTDVAALGLETCPPLPRPGFSFTQGVLCGQLSFVVISVLFLKYFVFEDPAADRAAPKSRDATRKRSNRPRKSSVSVASPTPAILAALEYDLPTHAPESLDWLNVLLAQALSAYRGLVAESTAGNGGGAKGMMEEMLNRKAPTEVTEHGAEPAPSLMGIDRIEVLDVALGDKHPVLSNARVRPSGEDGGVRVEIDVDFTDHVSLSISTCLLCNFPRPRFAVLPISLGLTLERFSGTLTLELPAPTLLNLTSFLSSSQPTSHAHANPTMHISLHPDFTLDLSTTSLLGSRAKLQDVPKVEQLILARIRGYIQDRVVWPGRVQVALPGVGHSHHHRRQSSHGAHLHERPSIGGGRPQVGGAQNDWEWVQEGSRTPSVFSSDDDELSPNADSTGLSTSEGGTPDIDLDADGGPSVVLHPKIRPRPEAVQEAGASPSTARRRQSSQAQQSTPGKSVASRGGGGRAPPSPTESLPGHFRPPPPFSYFPTPNGPAPTRPLAASASAAAPSRPPPSSSNGNGNGGGQGRWVQRSAPPQQTGGLSAARLAAVAAAAANENPSRGMFGEPGGMRYRMKGPGSVGMGVEVGSVGGGSRRGSMSMGRY